MHRDLELRLGFGTRAHRDQIKPWRIFFTTPLIAFGNIARNRKGRTPELIAEPLMTRKPGALGEKNDITRQRDGLLPRDELI